MSEESPVITPLLSTRGRLRALTHADSFGWSMAFSVTLASALVTPLTRGAVLGGIDPIAMLLVRLLIAVLLLGATMAVVAPQTLKIGGAALKDVLLVGLIAGVEICCFYWSLAWIDASMSAMLKSSQPVAVLLLLALGGERLTRRHLARLLLAGAGIYLLVGPTGPVVALGLLLTGLSVTLYAVQLVLIQWRLLAYDSRTMTLYLLVIMTAVVAVWWWVQGAQWHDPGTGGWLAILVMAVVSTYFARLAQFAVVRRLGSGQLALLWPLQTLLIILLSVLFLHERLTPLQWLGGALIIASAMLAIERMRARRVI